jgi:hypothetical protein
MPNVALSFTWWKDHMSYLHEEFVIDLAQVSQTTGVSKAGP